MGTSRLKEIVVKWYHTGSWRLRYGFKSRLFPCEVGRILIAMRYFALLSLFAYLAGILHLM